jgi:glutathione S-transferase
MKLGLSAVPAAPFQESGELSLGDITAVCAFGFTQSVLADLVETSRYHNLSEFCARAEALEPFRAAPPEDGVTAPLAIDD